MLFRKTDAGLIQWTGEPIDDIQHSRVIEQLWTKDELNAIGLYPLVNVDPPEGQIVDSMSLELIDGEVRQVYVTHDGTGKIREAAMRSLIERLNRATDPVFAAYPEAERSAWVAKESEARAFVVSQELTDVPLVTEVASLQFGQADDATRKQQVMAMCQIIIRKADAYRAISAQVEVLRIKSSAAMAAATTPEAIAATQTQFNLLIDQLKAAIDSQS